jgi:uncharacterized protein (DUF362 family)
MSRRKFIKTVGGLAVVAGASGGILYEVFKPKIVTELPRHVVPNAYTQNGKSLLSIVKGRSDTDVETMVREALDAIGGIERVVSSGTRVVVKPAVLSSAAYVAPNPNVVAAVARLAVDAGGSVVVAECSGGGDTEDCMTTQGITSAVQAVGAEVRYLDRESPIHIAIPNGVTLRDVLTFPTIYDCDVLISVPRLKSHGRPTPTVTISLKNMMGVIPLSEMSRFHNIGLSQCIADVNTVMKPNLTVVDATYVMAREGPAGGDIIEMDIVMASGDPVAIDLIGAQKLSELEQQHDIPTFDYTTIDHINAAAALGVGTSDPDNIVIVERNLS